VATLVTFHAHPDDESIATGGVMAQAADAGHRVVLVVATRGEQGEPVPGVLADGEALWERRVEETLRSAEILGAERVEFLGYEDSGMMGEPTNDNRNCFWQADVEAAAEKLAAVLHEVDADVLTVYDDHGGYGHPDHIQVHRVGVRAAELAGVPRVFEATMNRTRIQQMVAEMREQAEQARTESPEGEPPLSADERRAETASNDEFGTPEALITHAIDVTAYLERKRRSMEAHASQISDESFFLKMPPEAFATAFGTEWFIARGRRRGDGEPFATDLFEDL
jgi:LmbE family N-acetylglucosaminyl deacetylase